jgi:hypothetical protein
MDAPNEWLEALEPEGFDSETDDRVKAVFLPLVLMGIGVELDPISKLLLSSLSIVILAPVTLHVAGTVPVAVIVPLVAA